MLSLTPSSFRTTYYLYGLLLLSALSFLAPFMGLPPVRQGYFFQCEVGWGLLWGSGGGCALILFLLSQNYSFLLKKVFGLPIVWGWFLLGAVSFILSFFTPSPVMSFVGSPTLGEGILTFFSFSMLTASMFIVSKTSLRRPLIWCALITGLVSACMSLLGAQDSPFPAFRFWEWAPIYYGDYAVIIILSLFVFFYKLKFSKPLWAVGLLILAAMTYGASNRSFNGSLLLLPFFFLFVQMKLFKPFTWLKIGVVAIAVGITFFTLTYTLYETYLPDVIKRTVGYSLSARTYLGNVAFYDLIVRSLDLTWLKELVLGRGWGFFGSILAKNVFLIKDVTLFSQGQWAPNFEFVQRDLLHTHNTLGDFFLSLGLVGVFLFFWIKLKTINTLYRRDFWVGACFLLLYTLQAVFWFQLMHSWPYALMAFVCLFQKTSRLPLIKFHYLRLTLLPLFLLLNSWGAFHIYNACMTTHYWKPAGDQTLFANALRFLHTPVNWYDGLGGGQRLLEQTRKIVTEFYEQLPSFSYSEKQRALNTILSLADNLIHLVPEGSSYPPLILANNIYGEVSTHEILGKFFSQQGEALAKWDKIVEKIAFYLPYRGDLLIPYFHYLLLTQTSQKLEDFSHYILERNPQDPVARWFLGTYELQKDSTKTQGLCRLKKSLSLGIHKFMPLSEKTAHQIQQVTVYCKESE